MLYRLFRRDFGPAPSVRAAIIAMVLAAVAVTGLAIAQVARRHEVTRLGYALARASTRLTEAEELARRLELERATLAAPERIRALATRLGMVATPPDHIRVVHAPQSAAMTPQTAAIATEAPAAPSQEQASVTR